MEGAEMLPNLNHQRNKSEIVNLVKEIFSQDKWGDEEYKKKLQELVTKDEELVQEVIRKIKHGKRHRVKPAINPITLSLQMIQKHCE